MGERYLKSIRLLAECMQSFERFTTEDVRQYDLTHAQFDLIATLGNTPGMTYKELGKKTLITKGTMTGVVERLVQKGLVERECNADDKRSFFVRLTAAGEQLFQDMFPKITSRAKQLFVQADYTDADFAQLEQVLSRLKKVVDVQAAPSPAAPASVSGALLQHKEKL